MELVLTWFKLQRRNNGTRTPYQIPKIWMWLEFLQISWISWIIQIYHQISQISWILSLTHIFVTRTRSSTRTVALSYPNLCHVTLYYHILTHTNKLHKFNKSEKFNHRFGGFNKFNKFEEIWWNSNHIQIFGIGTWAWEQIDKILCIILL